MHNLYHVQDDDRPMYVIAESYGEAVKKWKEFVAEENELNIEEIDDPSGVLAICREDDLILI